MLHRVKIETVLYDCLSTRINSLNLKNYNVTFFIEENWYLLTLLDYFLLNTIPSSSHHAFSKLLQQNEKNEECGQIQEENYLDLTAFLVTP